MTRMAKGCAMVLKNGLLLLGRRQRRALTTGIATLCAVLGLSLAACATGAKQRSEVVAASGTPSVRDSGLEVSDNVGAIAWLSNDVVAFLALVPDVGRSWMIYPRNRLGVLTTWNLNTGELKQHGSAGYGRLCVRDGEVAQSDIEGTEESDGHGGKKLRFWFISGPLEHRIKREMTREVFKAVDFDIACRPQADLPPLPAGLSEFENGRRRVLRLRPEHGFVEYAPVPQPFHFVRLIPPGAQAKDGYPLAELRGDAILTPTYFPFKQAYGNAEQAIAKGDIKSS